MSDADWVSYEEALGLTMSAVSRTEAQRVPLSDALGRALRTRVRAVVPHPPWDNSAMDGFAVRVEEVRGAAPERPVTLPISDDIPAGGFPRGPLAPGSVARVMTGAPVPEGATGVVRVEHTDGGPGPQAQIPGDAAIDLSPGGQPESTGGSAERRARPGRAARPSSVADGEHRPHGPEPEVRIFDDADGERHIRRLGEDVNAGDPLLEAGEELGPAAVALLATAGRAEVDVGRRPRVGVLSNGDELADLDAFDEVLAGRKILNSNGHALAAQLAACGATPVPLGIARDDPAHLRQRLEAAAGCDAVVSAAGVSVGDHDYVKRVLDDLGFERSYWRVKMRPGSATVFGTLDGRPLWGVPGNPASALVTFETLVRPAIRKMAGFARPHRRPLPCVAGQEFRGPRDVVSFVRVLVSRTSPGGTAAATGAHLGDLTARISGPQGSGNLGSMLADGLLIIPHGTDTIAEGQPTHVIPLREWAAAPSHASSTSR